MNGLRDEQAEGVNAPSALPSGCSIKEYPHGKMIVCDLCKGGIEWGPFQEVGDTIYEHLVRYYVEPHMKRCSMKKRPFRTTVSWEPASMYRTRFLAYEEQQGEQHESKDQPDAEHEGSNEA